jgi:hypothetical protein
MLRHLYLTLKPKLFLELIDSSSEFNNSWIWKVGSLADRFFKREPPFPFLLLFPFFFEVNKGFGGTEATLSLSLSLSDHSSFPF